MSPTTASAARAKPGDLVVISGHRVGEPERLGEILEVFGDGMHRRYLVRWEDGRESIFYPDNDALIRPSTPRSRRSGTART